VAVHIRVRKGNISIVGLIYIDTYEWIPIHA
jgi:hypothetical protein